jgi:hypothetical protein
VAPSNVIFADNHGFHGADVTQSLAPISCYFDEPLYLINFRLKAGSISVP